MNELYFLSFDPGSPTGGALFDAAGELVKSFQIAYENAMQYMIELARIEELYPIGFVFIEQYLTFRPAAHRRFNSFKAQTQVQLIQEVFPNHIMVNPGQWNSPKFSDATKKELCEDLFEIPVTNGHKRDAALMGERSFAQARYQVGADVYLALNTLALTKRKWPTLNEMSLFVWWEKIREKYKPHVSAMEKPHVC